jgi:hypothetical protein
MSKTPIKKTATKASKPKLTTLKTTPETITPTIDNTIEKGIVEKVEKVEKIEKPKYEYPKGNVLFESDNIRGFKVKHLLPSKQDRIEIRIGVKIKARNIDIYRDFTKEDCHPKHIQSYFEKLDQDENYRNTVIDENTTWQWIGNWNENYDRTKELIENSPNHPNNQIKKEDALKTIKSKIGNKTAITRITDLVNTKVVLNNNQEYEIGLATICDFLLHNQITSEFTTQGHGTTINKRPKGPAIIKLFSVHNLPKELAPYYCESIKSLVFSEDNLVKINEELIKNYPQKISIAAANAATDYIKTLEFQNP